MRYRPDRFVIISVTLDNGEILDKVLGSWYGGFAKGDSWRANSGIKEVEINEDIITFHGYSGSSYICHKSTYGMSSLTASVLSNWKSQFGDRITMYDSIDCYLQKYNSGDSDFSNKLKAD